MNAGRWSVVAVAVLFLAGCGQAHMQARGSTLNLTAKDNHKVISVKRHTTIVLTLASNRSTGYRWELTAWRSPTEPLRLVSHRYVAPTRSVPGAAGKEIWRIRAAYRGGEAIGFVYVRPWERRKPAGFFGASIEVS